MRDTGRVVVLCIVVVAAVAAVYPFASEHDRRNAPAKIRPGNTFTNWLDERDPEYRRPVRHSAHYLTENERD